MQRAEATPIWVECRYVRFLRNAGSVCVLGREVPGPGRDPPFADNDAPSSPDDSRPRPSLMSLAYRCYILLFIDELQ